MAGIERTLTGNLNLAEKYELSAENDLLEISDATITLVVPADIFTNEGDDEVIIRNSKISGAEGTSFFLGSGSDILSIENSTIDIDTLAGSGDDTVTIAGSVSLSKELSLGTGDDLLMVTGMLVGTGSIDFGAGNNTLLLDGGNLKNTGTISAISNLEVTGKGGTISQDLAFSGESNSVSLAGDLTGDTATRTLNFSDATVSLDVTGNVVTNVGCRLINASLTQTPGATGASMVFSNCLNGALVVDNSEISFHSVFFERNSASHGGVAYLGDNALAYFTQAFFFFNSAPYGGAAYLGDNALAYFTQAFFFDNAALYGGAVYLDSGASANFTSASFSDNFAAASSAAGGAVYLDAGASANFTSASFSDNFADASSAAGGAVYLGSIAFANFTSASFSDNFAKAYSSVAGGAVYLDAGASANFADVSFSGNRASAASSAAGGAVYLGSGASANFTSARFSGNLASAASAAGGAVYLGYGASANFTSAGFSGNRASALGGAVYLASGASANFTDGSFSGNSARCGGALYLNRSNAYFSNTVAASANFTNVSFSSNFAALGGAVYGFSAYLSYSVREKDICNVGNVASAGGGFIYANKCSIFFSVDEGASLTIGAAGQDTDDIAGSGGNITKNGSGVMTIHSDISGYTGQWTVAQGELQLLSRSRSISSDKWSVSEDALLTLSKYADTVTLTGGWNLGGILDFGEGSDALVTGGYTLEGGKLYVQNLTISGGGTVRSQLLLRDADSSFVLTLAGANLDGNLIGGNASDTITVTAESTIGGTMDFGLGSNRVVINSAATLNGEVLLTAGGTTEIEVFRNASLAENVLTVRFDPNSELTQIDFAWADIPDLDKVRILISDDPTFRTYEFAIGLYNQSKNFTLYTEGTNFLQFQVQDEDGWKQQLLADEIAPEQVTNLEVSYLEGQPLLTWDAAHDNLGGNGVKQYRIQFATDTAFGTVVAEELTSSLEFAVASLNQGEYFVRVRAEDYTGNAGEWSTVQSFDFDNTPPDAPVVHASTILPTNQNVVVTATFSADSVQKQYSLNADENWLDYTAPVEFSDNGTVWFRAVDDHGNISEVTAYAVTNIDKVAPDAPTASANITAVTNRNVTVSAVFSEDSTQKQYSLDNSIWKTYTKDITMSANGTVWFRGTDAAGNVSEATAYEVTNIDKVAPEAPTATAAITSLTNQDVMVSATFSDDSADRQYSLDGQNWSEYAAPVVLSNNGTVYFRGIDAAGNVSEVTAYEVTNIDKVAPAAPTVTVNTTEPTNQNVTVTATFSDDTATKQYSTNNSTWKTYTKGVSMTKNGTVYFRGIDAAGNVSEVTAYEVTNIDKVAPDAPAAAANITEPTNQKVTVTATFSSDTAQKQYSTDGETWKTYTKGIAFTENGTIYFRGTDAAGNISEVTAYEVANIDKVAPNAVTGLSATQDRNTIVFSWNTATDDASGVAKYEIQVSDTADCSHLVASQSGSDLTAFNTNLTTSGTYHYRVRATDVAGNVSEWSTASVDFEFSDATPPTIPTNLQIAQDGANVIFSWNPSTDADSGVAGYELRLTRNGRTETVTQVVGNSVTQELAESQYDWSVAAKDNFGNVSDVATGNAFQVLLPADEPHTVVPANAGMPETANGTMGDDAFLFTPDGAWGTYHVARWNGGEEMVSLAGINRFYDAVIGGGGYDVLQLPSGDNGLLYSDLLTPKADGADAASRFTGLAEIDGGAGKDVIDLTDASGGYTGDILLKGDAGDDHLWAGAGDDILIGGTGDDDLRGGSGDDVYLFDANWGHDSILDDGGTLVFDNALKNRLSFSATADGTRITDGVNSVDLTWSVTSSAVLYADVASLTEMRRDTIKGFLA